MSTKTLPYQYLAVDGPIGVGKTTLVELLAKRFDGVKLLEDVENPFLPDFYRDRPGAAFQTQIYFLLSRFRHQQDLIQKGLFDRLVVADYPFHKDRIFAFLTLSEEELKLYDKLYRLLEPQVPEPDLIIYLVADVETCLERIRKRARSFERSLSRDYLRELIDAYNRYYHYYSRSPLLVVNTETLDIPRRPEDFQDLVHQLKRKIRGTEHYVPLGSQ